MDIIALALAAAAALIFLTDFVDRRRPSPRWVGLLPLALALLTVALICQFTQVSGTTVG